jgi:hypothetical protein
MRRDSMDWCGALKIEILLQYALTVSMLICIPFMKLSGESWKSIGVVYLGIQAIMHLVAILVLGLVKLTPIINGIC